MKKIPKWVKSIPESNSHGSGTYQKRLWRLVSDYVRISDWYKYKRCVATNRPIERWQDGQAGHFISYSKCNGIFKFDVDNIFLQSAYSNAWGDYDDWLAFEEEITTRGVDIVKLRAKNRDTSLKFSDTEVIELMKDTLKKMEELEDKPSYYDRVIANLEKE